MAIWNRSENDTHTAAPQTASPSPAVAPAAATESPPAAESGTPFLRPSLGADTSVTGKLSFDAPTRIDGRLKGEVRADDLLLIGRQGSVEGMVHAKALILEGSVKGDVCGTEWVQVHAGGRLVGSVEATRIEIAHGAKVQARMKITPTKDPGGERL